MLFWFTFQLRPMTTELAEAIVLKDDMRGTIHQRYQLLPGKVEYFIRICRSLIYYDARIQSLWLIRLSSPILRPPTSCKTRMLPNFSLMKALRKSYLYDVVYNTCFSLNFKAAIVNQRRVNSSGTRNGRSSRIVRIVGLCICN
jgi:hypothetical protein